MGVAILAQESSNYSTGTQCLNWLTTLEHYDTDAPGATIASIGCWSNATLMIPNITANSSDYWRQPLSTLWDRVDCAAKCASLVPTSTSVQFVLAYGACYCNSRSLPLNPRGEAASECCSREPAATATGCPVRELYGLVYNLVLTCRLDTTLCGQTPRCERSDGCCVPEGSVKKATAFHISLMQWMASFLMIAVVVQAIWWSVRMRFRRQDGGVGTLAEPMRRRVRLRSKEDATRQAQTVIPQFARAKPSEIDGESHCGICLDDLSEGDCMKTSCSHTFHLRCMGDYLAHGLRSFTNDVCCPMCRSILIVQVAGVDAENEGEEPLLGASSTIVVINPASVTEAEEPAVLETEEPTAPPREELTVEEIERL